MNRPIVCFQPLWTVVALVGAVAFPHAALGQQPQESPPGRPPAATAPAQPKLKAIWEPVNVKEDIDLLSVHFVSADEGWVAGGKSAMGGGVILHTADGGTTWTVQLGDVQSSDRAYKDLRFVDATTGFAAQSTGAGDHRLFRTTDGQNWLPVGTVAQYRTDYEFVSAQVGFVAARTQILRTTDGGKSWRPAYTCEVSAEVQGLTRSLACEFSKMFFLNPTTGYAISQPIERGAGFVVAKTVDGGMTWSASVVLPGEDGREGDVHFMNAESGVLLTIDGKLFRTADGGQTWTGVPGQAAGKPTFEFADADIGWLIVGRQMTYTSDGGKHWLSRDLGFPAPVHASSLPARDRGYAVGDHGLVYRYRIVPISYTSKGMLAAPAIAALPTK